MKIGVRVRLREAYTLYRHPNHNIFCHLVGAPNIHSLQLPLGASDVYDYGWDTGSVRITPYGCNVYG